MKYPDNVIREVQTSVPPPGEGVMVFCIWLVPGAGLEPARPRWPGDFKSPVSTNFTTRARRAAERARRIPRDRPFKTILGLKRSIFTPRTTHFLGTIAPSHPPEVTACLHRAANLNPGSALSWQQRAPQWASATSGGSQPKPPVMAALHFCSRIYFWLSYWPTRHSWPSC